MSKSKQLTRSQKMIAFSAFRLLAKGESVNFQDIVKACFGNIDNARNVMAVVNHNIVRYNRLTTKLAKSQYMSSEFTYLIS